MNTELLTENSPIFEEMNEEYFSVNKDLLQSIDLYCKVVSQLIDLPEPKVKETTTNKETLLQNNRKNRRKLDNLYKNLHPEYCFERWKRTSPENRDIQDGKCYIYENNQKIYLGEKSKFEKLLEGKKLNFS